MQNFLIIVWLIAAIHESTEYENFHVKMRTAIVERLSGEVASKVNAALVEAAAKNLTDEEIEDNFEKNFTYEEVHQYFEVVDLISAAMEKWKERSVREEPVIKAPSRRGKRPTFDAWEDDENLAPSNETNSVLKKEEL